METELKLYMITRFMDHLYNDEAKAVRELKVLLKDELLHPNYFDIWMERYREINQSQEMQILILKRAGAPYRHIQTALRVSPHTIQRVAHQYKLDYEPLESTSLLKFKIDEVTERLAEGGVVLWKE